MSRFRLLNHLVQLPAILAAAAMIPAAAAPAESPGLVTGSRSWKMADGTVKRLRFTGFSEDGAYVRCESGGKVGEVEQVASFSREEQAELAKFRDGRLKLVTTPGLSMDPVFPTGKIPAGLMDPASLWLGETRIWENSRGKRVEGRLICLTDEDVSLLVGETVAKVALPDLAAADLAYIGRLKAGEARTFPARVDVAGRSWDRGHGYNVQVSGERYAQLAAQGSGFETALRAALRHVESKLDREKWELVSFTERRALPPLGTRNPAVTPAVPDPAERPFEYHAEFRIDKRAEAEARRLWPLLTTPANFGGDTTLYLHAMADGTVLEAGRAN